MDHYHFTVLLEPDQDEPHRYNVRVPALPGCLTYGESIEDALAHAREAITGYVAVMVEAGESVPVEEHPIIATTLVIPGMSATRPLREVAVSTAKSERPA